MSWIRPASQQLGTANSPVFYRIIWAHLGLAQPLATVCYQPPANRALSRLSCILDRQRKVKRCALLNSANSPNAAIVALDDLPVYPIKVENGKVYIGKAEFSKKMTRYDFTLKADQALYDAKRARKRSERSDNITHDVPQS